MHYNHIAYADGRLARKTFSNGTETSYAYNAEGHLAELTHRDREGILDRYVYGYDLMGNRTAMEKHRRGLNWKKATANPYVLFAGNPIINTGAICITVFDRLSLFVFMVLYYMAHGICTDNSK